MTYRIILTFISTICFFTVILSCNKKDQKNNKIDVSAQWTVDPSGNILSSTNDMQWGRQTFTVEELSMFSSMDTANLNGTTLPANMKEAANYPYPNPFDDVHMLTFNLGAGFSGSVVLKYVLVDQSLNAIDKKVVRLNTQSGFATVAVKPDLTAGRYRLYYSLSAQSKPHFYTSWGNIQKY